MMHRLIIRKYSRGFARTVESENEFQNCLEQIKALVELLASSPVLKYSLTSAFVPRAKKEQLLEEIFKRGEFDPRVIRLVELLLQKEKIILLPEILQDLPEVWAEEKGIEVVEVNSAVELTEAEKEELRKVLETGWRKPIRLSFRLNPEIIGGLVVRRKSVSYDISVRGSLEKIKEIVSQR